MKTHLIVFISETALVIIAQPKNAPPGHFKRFGVNTRVKEPANKDLFQFIEC
jgi:hypothetical protein